MLTPEQFELLMQLACGWVTEQQNLVLRDGVPLSPEQASDARQLGVAYPERVRVLQVDVIPRPHHPALIEVRWLTGLLSTASVGLTVGYGVFLQSACWGVRHLLCHELVHVGQYERMGVPGFLRQYLHECITMGYPAGALEQEAIILSRKYCTPQG